MQKFTNQERWKSRQKLSTCSNYQMLTSTVQLISATPFTTDQSGNVSSSSSVMPPSMEEFFSSILNMIHGPFQTFLGSPVWRLENLDKHFRAALPTNINKFNFTGPNTKASLDSSCSFQRTMSGQLGAQIMFTHVWMIFMMLMPKKYQQILETKSEMQSESLSSKESELQTSMLMFGQQTILVLIDFWHYLVLIPLRYLKTERKGQNWDKIQNHFMTFKSTPNPFLRISW